MTNQAPDKRQDDDTFCVCFSSPRLTVWFLFGPALIWLVLQVVYLAGGPNLAMFVAPSVFLPVIPACFRYVRGAAWALTRTGRDYRAAANPGTYACVHDAYKAGCPPEKYLLTHWAVIHARRNLPTLPFLTRTRQPTPTRAAAWAGVRPVLDVIIHNQDGLVAAAWAGASVRTHDQGASWVNTLTGMHESRLERAGDPHAWADQQLPIELVRTGYRYDAAANAWLVARKAGMTDPTEVTSWVTSGLWDVITGRYSPNEPDTPAVVRAWAATGAPVPSMVRAARLGWEPGQVAAQHADGTLEDTLDLTEALA